MDEIATVPLYTVKSVKLILADALKNGDALIPFQENQKMLINVKGVSINAKPRKDGRYQGYLLSEGEKRYFYGSSREQVAEKIREAIFAPKPKKAKKKATPTLSEWLDKWFELYKKPNLKPVSLYNLQLTIKRLKKAFGDKPLESFKTDDLQAYLLSMESASLRDLTKLYLLQAFKKAKTNGIIKNDPCVGLDIKPAKKKHRNALTRSQQAEFLNAIAGSKYEPVLLLLLTTGLRIGEALALTEADLDREKRTVSVSKNLISIGAKQYLQSTPKSDKSIRTVPVPQSTLDKLKLPFVVKQSAVNAYCHNLPLSFSVSPHILRHTYATRLEESGISPKLKQYLMGHSSLQMTQNVYTDIQEDFVSSQASNIERIFDIKNS